MLDKAIGMGKTMKVLLYQGGILIVKKSGIGVAYEHQKKALFENHIPFTVALKNEYDIAQFNTIFPDSVLVAYFLKRKGKKIIYYGHSTMEDFKKSFKGSDLFAPLFKKWIKFCYSLGDVIITPTQYSKTLLERYGIQKPIYAVSNGIDLDFYKRENGNRNRFRAKYNLGDNEIHMAVVTPEYEAAHIFHKEMDCICYENEGMGLYFIADPDGYWTEIIGRK